MAVAIDSTSFASATNAELSKSWSHTCSGSDRVLYVACSIDASTVSQEFSTATYNGVAMTQLLAGANTGGGRPIYLWRLIAPATGANNIAFTWGTAFAAYGAFVAASFTGVDQTTPESVSALTLATGNSLSPASGAITGPAADLLLGILAYNNALTSDITEGGSQTNQIDYALDNTRTLVRMSTKAGSGSSTTMSWSKGSASNEWGTTALAIKAASSAPVLTSGTPTGTVGSAPAVGCTTTVAAGTIRFVIDSDTALDGVLAAQVLLGQNENGVDAAYDSGDVVVTDTTPDYAFTGLPNGVWRVAAAHSSGGNSNVLTWTITVAPPIDLAGPAGAESAATGALTTPTLVFNLADIDNNSIKASITYSWVYVFSDDQNIVTYFSNVTTDALGVMRIRSDLINVPGATYHIMGFNADWSEKFHAHAVLADG